jgi:alpha-1,6-mannosyltransferase
MAVGQGPATGWKLSHTASAWRSRMRMPPPDGRPAGRYVQPACIGLLGTGLIALAASLPGAPFADKVPGAWFFGAPGNDPSGLVVRASGVLLFIELACGFAGLLLLIRAWLAITRNVMGATGVRPWRLARILALWSVPLLAAPPLFSDDIYSYAAQGEMVGLHISPYLYGPGVLGATPFESLAQGYWISTPSPYGPLFTGLEGDIVRVADYRVLLSLVLLRLLAVVGVALAALSLPSLARRTDRDPGSAFALGLLNPLVLLFLIGSGHNDALMIGLLVAGLSLARAGHPSLGTVLCALAGAVKAPGIIGVVAIALTCAWAAPSLWRRASSLGKSALITVATFEAVSLLFGAGWGWVHNLGATAEFPNWITPTDLLAIATSHLADLLRVQVSVASLDGPYHLGGLGAAGVIGLWAFSRLPELGMLRAVGISFLAVVLLGPSVQPWYLVWGIVILAATDEARMAAGIVWLTVVASFLGLVGLNLLATEWGSLGPSLELLLLAVLLASAITPISTYPIPKKSQPPRDVRTFQQLRIER